MSEMFTNFEEQFSSRLKDANFDISKLDKTPPEQKLEKAQGIAKMLTEAEKFYRQMEIEVSMMSPADRGASQTAVRGYRRELETIRKDFR